jgi:hypothetical protein
MRLDEERSARLLLDCPADSWVLARRAVRRALRQARVPPRPVRLAQAAALKAGLLSWDRSVVEPYVRARAAALDGAASGPPRVLVRVDEFPHARSWDPDGEYGVERFERFHELVAAEGVPYLLAVCARVSRGYLNPAVRDRRPLDTRETGLLGRLAEEGVSFAVHGYDHRSRRPSPRDRSELAGLGPAALHELLERARRELAEAGIEARVFAPPSTASTSASTPRWHAASMSCAGVPRRSGCSVSSAHRCGSGTRSTFPPIRPSMAAQTRCCRPWSG